MCWTSPVFFSLQLFPLKRLRDRDLAVIVTALVSGVAVIVAALEVMRDGEDQSSLQIKK